MLEYYQLLRTVLRAKPHLRACLTRCGHCRIFFLTHPRNAGRHDLRCPFGCREAHRKRASAKRSAAYYDAAEGKIKKSLINQRRPSKASAARPPGEPPGVPEPKPCPFQWNPEIVGHVRVVVSLIEGRPASRREVLEMLERVLRQHSMCRRRKTDHAVAWLNEEPP